MLLQASFSAHGPPHMHPKLKLTYFDGPGRAEAIRLTLYVGGIPFEDERLNYAQFAAAKAAGRFKNGQVPVLEVDGVQLAQSNAILIFAGKLARLYPWDPLAALKVEEFLANIEDVSSLSGPAYAEQDPVKRAQVFSEIAKGPWHAWFSRIDAALAKNPAGFVVGDSLTIADLRGFAVWTSKVDGVPQDYFDQFPHITAHKNKIAAHPLVQEYYLRRKHKPFLKLTYFDIPGLAEAIRLSFHVAAIPFVDERLTQEQFKAAKAAGHFKNGQVPVLQVDNKQIAQSNAILIYAGKLARLYPQDPLAALKVEEFLANIDDVNALFRPSYDEPDLAKRAVLRGEVASGPAMTGWYARLDTALGSNPSGFVVGNSLTVADLRAYAVWTRHVDGVPADYFDHWPHIVAHKKKIAALPEIAAYYAAKVPAESKA